MTREKKDSGIEWIGEIPNDWKIIKIKHKYSFKTGFTPPSKNDLYYDNKNGHLWVTISDLSKNKHVEITENRISNSFVEEYNPEITPKGSLLYSFKLSIGVKGFAKTDLFTNEAIASFYISDNIYYSRFLYYSSYLIEFNAGENIYGAKLLNQDLIKNAKVVFPPLKEQEKIVKKLDKLCNNIDCVINDTKQSIEGLKKYKQSIMTEAVTKGLAPNVEMKDSGIEWIGKLPEAWNVIKINQLFSIKKKIANQTGYDVLSVTQRGLKVKDITQNEGQMAADYSKYQIVQPDDFVMNHMDLLTGWVDTAVQEGVTSPDYRVFYNKQKELVFNPFYLYIFQICYLNKIFYGLGQGVSNMGRWRLQTDKFLNFYLPLPSIEEQKEIVTYLDSQIEKLDNLIQDKEKTIEELEQYKKSLIYEYVTGKKEV